MSDELIAEAVAKERERCARICEMRAEITENSARKTRLEGTFNASQLTWRWPFIRSVPAVAFRWEMAARDLDAFARAMRQTARFIRDGEQIHD